MSNKFEQLLDLLINEENDKAEALFHEIVVEKSREIYENLAETDLEEEAEELEEETVEEFEVVEAEDDEAEEAEETDAESNEESEDEVEGAIDDLEDALQKLKDEFEAMMANNDNDDDSEEEVEQDMTDDLVNDVESEQVVEYKIAKKADTADHSDNTKSPVANKNDMGGTASNIAQGSAEEKGASAPSAQSMSEFENTAGKDKSTSFKKNEKADNADHSDKTAKSPVNK